MSAMEDDEYMGEREPLSPAESLPTAMLTDSVDAAPLQQPAADKLLVEDHSLDLEMYIANYQGPTKVARLQHIASVCPSLAVDALRMAARDLKNTVNTAQYVRIIELLYATLANANVTPAAEDQLDHAWVESVNRKANATLVRLNDELKSYRNTSIKESIRLGSTEIGNFQYARGDYGEAGKSYMRTRDNCTTPIHIAELCLNVMRVGIQQRAWQQVMSYVKRAETTPGVPTSSPELAYLLKCCAGLASLSCSSYRQAAVAFLEAKIDPSISSPSEFFSFQDIAVYSVLCALSTFTRPEIKRRLIENPSFKGFLEYSPESREILMGFYSSQYSSMFRAISKVRSNWLLDVYLASHVETLLGSIRTKAIVQYTSPFVTIDMSRMADSFACDVSALEQELTALIMSGNISARIDSHKKVLIAREVNDRGATYSKALAAGEAYQREVRAILLRISMIQEDKTVRAKGRDVSDFDELTSRETMMRVRGRAHPRRTGDRSGLFGERLANSDM